KRPTAGLAGWGFHRRRRPTHLGASASSTCPIRTDTSSASPSPSNRKGDYVMEFGIAVASPLDSWKVVKRAEELGFSHAWFYDTQMLSPDIFATMALAAVNTKKIKLGSGVLVSSNRIAPVAAT